MLLYRDGKRKLKNDGADGRAVGPPVAFEEDRKSAEPRQPNE